MSPAAMFPMTGIPDPARMRGLGPVPTDGDISAVTPCPFFVDPDVARARSNRPYDRVPNGAYRYKDLCGNGVGERTHAECQGKQKGQFYNFTLHMLVFKFKDWTTNSIKS